jgi:peptide/nickel transport system permease protein
MTFDTRSPAPNPDETRALAMPKKRGSSFRTLLKNPFAAFSIAYLLLVVVVGIFGAWIAPYGPNTTDLSSINAAPFTSEHLLGADASGRDIFSRIIWGTQQTIIACVLVLGVSLVLGLTFGLIAGFYRGRTEAIINFASDTMMSMPGIVLLIALYALTGPNIPVAMAVFGLVVAPTFYRLVRSVVLSVRSELYVDAAKVVGLSDARIIGRHVLSAVRAPVIVQSAFVLSTAIGILAGVDFLGLGNPSQPSWGRILQEAFKNIYTSPQNIVWPSIVISVSILSFVLLGNALRDALQASNRSAALKPTPAARTGSPEFPSGCNQRRRLGHRGARPPHRLPVEPDRRYGGRARRQSRYPKGPHPRPCRRVRIRKITDRVLDPRHPSEGGRHPRRKHRVRG